MTNEAGLEFEAVESKTTCESEIGKVSMSERQAALDDCGYWADQKDILSLTEAVADHWETIRAALSAPAQVSTPLSRACETALLTFPPKEELNDWFDKYGHVVEDALRASITPAVPVIPGLEEAIEWAGIHARDDEMRSEMMEELLPCPFCGVIPTVDHDDAGPYNKRWLVECDELDCHSLSVSVISKISQADANRLWNTRALPKLQKVDLDACFKDLSPYVGSKYDILYGYNSAIADIKAKYGELYTEVK